MTARSLGIGAFAGIAGGVVFGIMMQAMGMIGMVAGLVGAEGAAAGWGVHLVNSAIIGAIFGLVASRVRGWGAAAGTGTAYGFVWWILGALLIMPLWMGMPPFQLDETAMYSLVGHLMYGVVTGVVFLALARQTDTEPAAASSRA